MKEYQLAQIKARHIHCVTMQDILRDVQQGNIPKYFEDPGRYTPSCSYPEDNLCAAPTVSDKMIIEKWEELHRKEDE